MEAETRAWSRRQVALRAWLRERAALPGPKLSLILDRKYKQKNALGFAGVSTLLASYVISELTGSGIVLGFGRDNRQFVDKIIAHCPSTLTLVTKGPGGCRFKSADDGPERAWTNVSIIDTDASNVRGVGTHLTTIVSDSMSHGTLIGAVVWIRHHPNLLRDQDVHMIWVVKTREEKEDDSVRESLADLPMVYEIYELEK
jgi:hypothetical protein